MGEIEREDQDFEDQIKLINAKLENFYKGRGIRFINNNDIDGTCLNRSRLHLSKSGTALLIKNVSKVVSSA